MANLLRFGHSMSGTTFGVLENEKQEIEIWIEAAGDGLQYKLTEEPERQLRELLNKRESCRDSGNKTEELQAEFEEIENLLYLTWEENKYESTKQYQLLEAIIEKLKDLSK